MSICPNCKTSLGCGCQITAAADGTRVCVNCVGKYNASLKNSNNVVQEQTRPSNVTVIYTPPKLDSL